MPFSTTTYVDRTGALPGERCRFHPDCCDPDDTECTGCGAEATGAFTFRRENETMPGRRVGYCADHSGDVAEGVVQMLQQQDTAALN